MRLPKHLLPWSNVSFDELYNRYEPLLAGFYLVKPSRTMAASIEEVPSFIVMVERVAPILIISEMLLLWCRRKRLQYRWNDSLVGVALLLTGKIPVAIITTLLYTFYAWLHRHYRLIDVPYDSLWTWLFSLLAIDLSFYIAHRAVHEVNLLWAAHAVHHSSQFYAATTGIRLSFMDNAAILTLAMPWSFLLPPGPLLAHQQLNLVYQLWVHTKAIGYMGPLEYIIQTPTRHEIHHGVNRFCVDTNYGGFLVIWDVLFGTVEWPHHHRRQTIYMGISPQVKSWDISHILTRGYVDIYRRVKLYTNIGDKLSAIFKGPNWTPGKPRLGIKAQIPLEPRDKIPYNKTSSRVIYLYCAVHLYIAFLVTAAVIESQWVLPYHEQLLCQLFVLWTTFNVGFLLEHRWYAAYSEPIRCAAFFVFELLLRKTFQNAFGSLQPIIMVSNAASAALWVSHLSSSSRARSAIC